MPDKRQLEFFLLRYVPDALRDDFVTFGVVLLEPAVNGLGYADVRFARDWRRVRCLDPDADVEVLEALEREVQTHLRDTQSREALLKRLNDSFSNLIQVSPIKTCLAAEPAKELETLARLFVEPLQRRGARMVSDRRHVLGRMHDAFEQAGILGLLTHNIPVAPYTRPGDPLQFDFAYRVGDSIKIFHALSLKTSVEQAVTIAARYPSIKEGISRMSAATSFLTAVVDDGLDRTKEQVQFALGMMEEARISVETASQMPAIAEAARQELVKT